MRRVDLAEPTWTVLVARIRIGSVVMLRSLARRLAIRVVWSKPRSRMWRLMVGRGTMAVFLGSLGRMASRISARGLARARTEWYL